MYQNYPKTMPMSQVTEFQSKVYIRWGRRGGGDKQDKKAHWKKCKSWIKQTEAQASLVRFYT